MPHFLMKEQKVEERKKKEKDLKQLLYYFLKYSSIIFTKNLMIAQQTFKNSALQENFHAVLLYIFFKYMVCW